MNGENNINIGDPSSPFFDNPKDDNIRIEDQGDLIAKFLYEPNHRHYTGEDYFDFLNKNHILTHTTDEEAQFMRPLIESMVILNRHKEEKTVLVDSGEFEKIGEDGEKVIVRPIMIEKTVFCDRFAITERNLQAVINAVTVTAAGRGGMFIKDSKTVRLEKEQSIEDRTDTRPGFWAKVKKK